MDSIRKKSNNSTEEFSVNSNQTTEISYINNDNAAKKMVKKQRHIANMICVICEGPATGHNFSQISCHSCKGKHIYSVSILFENPFFFSFRIFSS